MQYINMQILKLQALNFNQQPVYWLRHVSHFYGASIQAAAVLIDITH